MKVGLALVGGGLANSLIAHRLLDDNPEYSLVVIERQSSLGGNHTWSFHDSDLTDIQRRRLQPLIVHSWAAHELRFPRRRRVMDAGYNTVSSERLHEVVSRMLGRRCMLDATVTDVTATRVTLEDGTKIEADAVIDGRGHSKDHHLDVAFQKFVGVFLRLERHHDLSGPILMDATVEQLDGYRFVYTLPFSSHDLLVEDTYYSNAPDLDNAELQERILAYVARQGWAVAEQTGMEAGVLPIVLGGDIYSSWQQGPAGVARSGMRAVLFHQTTGYSLPEGVRLADEIADLQGLDNGAVYELTKRRSIQLWRGQAFFRFLNRMLFRAAEPEQRYRIFERFYGLQKTLIERFYAGQLNWADKLRLLTGKPPVPVHRAVRCLFEPRPQVSDAMVEREETT